jgi:Domain of unknown function (DUF3598)
MASQWQNFLRNLGEWRGSFTSVDTHGALGESTPSILNLESAEEDRLVRFRLRRFGPGGVEGEPIRESREDYRSLGRQVVFFPSGSFCKGTLQVAPGTAFGGEFGFIARDRRHRLVQLHNAAGALDGLVLIRETRTGTEALERPPLDPEQLLGAWRGEAATITADWPEPDHSSAELSVTAPAPDRLSLDLQLGSERLCSSGLLQGRQLLLEGDAPARLQFLPDGGCHLTPLQVSHRQAFCVQAGWLMAPDQLQWLIRRFDASGAWQASTQLLLKRV